MKAVASYIKLQIDAAYVKLQALTTYQHLAIEVQYVLLKVTAITGKFVEYIYVDDTLTEVDATTLAITKQLTDIAELAEQISLGVNKPLSDSTAMSDLFILAVTFNRTFADTTSFSDATTRSVSKVLADSVTETDAATRAVTKLIADAVAMADSVVGINFTDAENDALAIDDLGIDDDPAWNLGKNLSDTASTTDAGLLIMQDYCDITYFLEDYVGLSRTF
jgi:hypothetical protein